ncbi:hypothetical protein BD779DRAFT_1490739 [Infundibulicybe gibba]|nr:hypothetical protein BD779DRAFT_1490739 [Infundibulicybe gibba]
MSEQVAAGNLSTQAASGGVLVKLVLFSLALGAVPISSYFLALKYVWNGNATYAAITAVFAANIVLVAYIVVSLLEDKQILAPVSKSVEKRKRQ